MTDLTTTPRTPMDILERAYSLEADHYEEFPIFLLLGRGWYLDEALRRSLRQLRQARLVVDGGAPGFLRLP
jgi:hypothetical protein